MKLLMSHFSQHPFLKHAHSVFYFQCEGPDFTVSPPSIAPPVSTKEREEERILM
jgi:hypothetical protein